MVRREGFAGPGRIDPGVERSIDVRTGESIAIRYELAGLGSRFFALAADLTLQVVAVTIVFSLIGLAAGPLAVASASLPRWLVGDQRVFQAFVVALVSAMLFAIFFGYFIIFELWWSGRTPGKRLVGIRVVRDAGFPLDPGAAIVRNVVRLADVALGFYAVSAIVALLSPENKRLGDIAAGTIVVRDRRYERADLDVIVARDTAQDDGLSAEDVDLIERFLARRATLTGAARADLARRIATSVRPKLRATFDHLDDESLLEHLGRS
jgi:uncharacterized RDD family membrane protein YckC